MADPTGGKQPVLSSALDIPAQSTTTSLEKGGFVKVSKPCLEKLTTEVMQIQEFLPKILKRDLRELLLRSAAFESMLNVGMKKQEQLQQENLHLHSQLEATQNECQREKEEKLLVRKHLWQSITEVKQQVDFCYELGSSACSLLWSCSSSEDVVVRWLGEGKLPPFLAVAAQTLESFVTSLDEESGAEDVDSRSSEHQFVLAVAGIIVNVAAVPSGRDFLASSAQSLLNTLMENLQRMKPGDFPKLKVLMLMVLYNVSISVEGLKYISACSKFFPVISTALEDEDPEVCLHALHLFQSVVLDEVSFASFGPSVLGQSFMGRLDQLTNANQPSLRALAQQSLGELQTLSQGLESG